VGLALRAHGPAREEVVAARGAQRAGASPGGPVCLGPGGAVKQDLPRLVAAAARGDVRIHLDKPIGEQPQVVEAIASAIAQAR
jgi:sirohydrochlorin ferrochelatase